MKIKNIKKLQCPNCSHSNLEYQAFEISRKDLTLNNLEYSDLKESDHIKTGLLICSNCNTAFPIKDYITILLSIDDVDTSHAELVLRELSVLANSDTKEILDSTISKFK